MGIKMKFSQEKIPVPQQTVMILHRLGLDSSRGTVQYIKQDV